MKNLIFIIVFHLSVIQAWSQTLIDSIYTSTHGIIQKELTFYEVEGYNVFVFQYNFSFNQDNINKIKKQYQIKSNGMSIKDPFLKKGKLFVDTQMKTKSIFQSDIYYLFPSNENSISIIGFQTFLIRDIDFEHAFAKAILKNTIPKSSYSETKLDSINFVGRTLIFDFNCNWKRPHNVQCPFLGQMNWALFRNENRSKEFLNKQYELTADKSIGEIVQNDTVDILFEKNKTKALKVTFKLHMPNSDKNKDNTLIIYYVSCLVRGKYIACVLSHYSDEVDENELPPLINEVMQLSF